MDLPLRVLIRAMIMLEAPLTKSTIFRSVIAFSIKRLNASFSIVAEETPVLVNHLVLLVLHYGMYAILSTALVYHFSHHQLKPTLQLQGSPTPFLSLLPTVPLQLRSHTTSEFEKNVLSDKKLRFKNLQTHAWLIKVVP